MDNTLLRVKNLSLGLNNPKNEKLLIDNVSFDIKKNEIVSIIGESGSGKTLTAMSILGLLDKALFNISGQIIFNKINLLSVNEAKIQKIRSHYISIVFQNPMSSLNPTMKLGKQIYEVFHSHIDLNYNSVNKRIKELIKKVKLDGVKNLFEKYPHEISGGQMQRFMLVMALASSPKLLIADEPTTALDVTVQKEIIEILKSLQKTENLSILLISHNIGLVKNISNKIIVMKEGKLIENNHTQLILQSPKKKYTKGLLSININNKKRVKKLNTLQNFEKEIQNNNISKRTRNNRLKLLYEKEPLMIVRNVSKYYSRFVNFRKKVNFKALKNINIKLYEGETLGIIGESGSGKTTLSEVIMKIKKYEFGNIFYKNKNINKFNKTEMLNYRKEVQIVFQDPYSSLNPLFNVKEIIAEPIKCHNIFEKKSEIDKKCKELINDVKIGQSYLNKYPHELSGGQRQRVAIARAISINPKILILDESVSALDVSIQASILNLLTEIKEKYNLSYIFISHDLSVVKHMSDKIAVFLNGKIVEYADADLLFKSPKKEYTKALLRSAIN